MPFTVLLSLCHCDLHGATEPVSGGTHVTSGGARVVSRHCWDYQGAEQAMAAVWRVRYLPDGGQHLRLPAVQRRSLRQLLRLLPRLVYRVRDSIRHRSQFAQAHIGEELCPGPWLRGRNSQVPQ